MPIPCPAKGSRFKPRPEAADHWHRTESDPGRSYSFKDADTLLEIDPYSLNDRLEFA